MDLIIIDGKEVVETKSNAFSDFLVEKYLLSEELFKTSKRYKLATDPDVNIITFPIVNFRLFEDDIKTFQDMEKDCIQIIINPTSNLTEGPEAGGLIMFIDRRSGGQYYRKNL